ncbi:MAG: hypothetical protein A4E36_01725 [Methanoregulaceae archaeon PtaB.Bin009]|nr:MAG: hypothetical protein A4E36_01725 [Methanoregulaceae archaeon PtaB.Bin009]
MAVQYLPAIFRMNEICEWPRSEDICRVAKKPDQRRIDMHHAVTLRHKDAFSRSLKEEPIILFTLANLLLSPYAIGDIDNDSPHADNPAILYHGRGIDRDRKRTAVFPECPVLPRLLFRRSFFQHIAKRDFSPIPIIGHDHVHGIHSLPEILLGIPEHLERNPVCIRHSAIGIGFVDYLR